MAVALAAPPAATRTGDGEGQSRAQIHALIAPFAKANSVQGYKSFAVDLALYAFGIVAVLFFDNLAGKIAGGLVAGAALVNLGALLHEAAHRAVVKSRRGNKVIAVISMTLCLFNYRLWIYDHHVLHHARTNVKGNNFLSPITFPEYRAMSSLRRALYRAYHSPSGAGILLYFLIERWPTVHFYPGSWLPQRFRRSALGYAALQAGFAAALIGVLISVPLATGASVAASVLCGFVLPYTIWFATFSMTVFLQHTNPQVRWYRDAASSPPEALSVHVGIPHWINHMSHYGLEHPVHHVSAIIPHYRLKEAQAVLAGIASPPVIFMRFTAANLRDVVTRCRLYDYDAHAWMDFDGEVTALPLERGAMRAAPPVGEHLPEQAEPASPGAIYRSEREIAARQQAALSNQENV
ncbi:fatty acid desaturase [Novosphingobium sp. Gsoil 351]|uniref:fatty acid desaturase n=1 Tax=Novosphingobium sp. Gsoil 351 TaxID=2675225 RepID=UPI0018A851DF|nr:fatty acid desaturase [Novosphingobium sp. Gsoil 351]